MKFEIQMLQELWKIGILQTSTGLQILVTSTWVHHQITLITVNHYRPSPEWQGRRSPSPSTAYPSRPKVSDSNVRGSKINETSKRHSESVLMAKFPLLSTIVQASQVFAVFYNHHKLRMTNNLRAILKWPGRTNRPNRCLGKSENYQYQMKESMLILVVFQLTYSHLWVAQIN